jgi:opacity protein-like surface antigen
MAMLRLALATAAAGVVAGSTFAAEMPVKAPRASAPIVAPSYNWSGAYIGANFGSAWSNGSLAIPGNNFYGGTTEFIGGLQAGYNIQAGQLLFGVEGDIDWATFNHPALPAPTLGAVSQQWISTLAGRAGIVNDRWLVFGKLGGGWAQSTAMIALPGSAWSGSAVTGGWLVGGGIEYGFKPHWTVKLEYDHLALSNWNSPTVPPVALSRDIDMVKAGINYKFVSGASAAEASRAAGGGEPTEDLQKQSQNPIADLVSVPFQSNSNFNSGPFNRTQEVLNIQPVIPMHLNSEWNVISRTIVPLVSQPDPIQNASANGIGDITQSLFFSPAHPGPLIWGAGPVFTIPSASDPTLGTGRVLAGPTAVFLVTPGHWVLGVLLNNQWSIDGNALRAPVNSFLAQPFVNYNMADGWYLTSSPAITSNWLAAPGQQWTLPLGGGVGRVFRVGEQPVNASLAGYYNAIHPTGTSNWQLRAQLALLFPVK